MHTCESCGLLHGHADPDDGAALVPAAAPVIEVPSGPNEHDVAIAEIEAAASVERARIDLEALNSEQAAEIERLRGQLAGIEQGAEIAADAAADAAPAGAPIIVEPPAAPAEAAAVPPPPAATETPGPPRKERKSNYFGF